MNLRAFILLVNVGCVACRELPVSYNAKSMATDVGVCEPTEGIEEIIRQDLRSIISSSIIIVPKLIGGTWNLHIGVVVQDGEELPISICLT